MLLKGHHCDPSVVFLHCRQVVVYQQKRVSNAFAYTSTIA